MKLKQLFQRDFTLVVAGQVISLFGNAILRFALPLYLLRETGSSALFGVVTACSFIPMIVLSLVGGVLADRVNKRNIMVILDFSTAALIVLFYFMLGEIPLVPLLIVFLMILYGISGTYQPAVQASIPVLVDKGSLMQGNAVINLVNTLSGLLGPVIGGVLFGAWGIFPILIVSVGCFTASAIMEIFIHIPFKRQKKGEGVLAVVRNDLKESWHFVKNEKPVFLGVVFVLAAFNLVLSSAMIIGLPVMIINFLGMSDASLGFSQGAMGLGGLAGGLLAGAVSRKLKPRHGHIILFTCSLIAVCMGLALLPVFSVSVSYGIITVMIFFEMAASTIFTIQMSTIVLQQTPEHLVGKIMAAIIAVAMCAQPLGQAFYGFMFDICGDFPWAVMVGAAVAAVFISIYSKRTFIKLEE